MTKLPELGQRNRRIPVSIEVAGTEFKFKVWCRALGVAEDITVHYCWFDQKELRVGTSSELWRKVVDVFWAAACNENLSADERAEAEEVRVLAEMLPVARPRLANRYFADGALGRILRDRTVTLDDELEAVKELGGVESKEYSAALDVLDEALIRPNCKRIRQLIGDEMELGRQALSGGERDWRRFRKSVGDRLRKLQNRPIRTESDQADKDLVSVLSSQAKAAFFQCYAQSWAYLVPALAERYGMSKESDSFMLLWHMQQHEFKGHVFALHPVSAVIMEVPDILSLLGSYLREPESEQGGKMRTAAITLGLQIYHRLKMEEKDRGRKSEIPFDPSMLDDRMGQTGNKR